MYTANLGVHSLQKRVVVSNRRRTLIDGESGRIRTTRSGETSNLAAVFLRTSSSVTPAASSVRMSFLFLRSTWNTQRSVMMVETQLTPVSGSEHSSKIFGLPPLATWSITTTTLVASGFETRSIAPPIPLTILPGIM